VTIQSFDFRVLQVFRKKYPHVKLAALVENQKSWEENIKALGFTPDIYSCYYELLTKDIVLALQKKKMKVIPWTVNERADMDRLLDWGVDGLITDYPNRTK
jgi:glycerophosphoryl diester phosphodiesterase